MNTLPQENTNIGPATVVLPPRQTLPVIFASPHSGRHYPQDFIDQAQIDAFALRASEDAFVDRLFAEAPKLGAPMLCATFPRAYVDVNRAPLELDPRMFDGPLPDNAETHSMRALSGLGSVPRVVSGGIEIYRDKLPAAEATRRINTYYQPYHQALGKLIELTKASFGFCILIDCHSMPGDSKNSEKEIVEVVLGDCYGSSCHPSLTEFTSDCLKGLGYTPSHNEPYAGGYCTRHYGQPEKNVHALQIELSRALYMDEETLIPHSGFDVLREQMTVLISRFHDFDGNILS